MARRKSTQRKGSRSKAAPRRTRARLAPRARERGLDAGGVRLAPDAAEFGGSGFALPERIETEAVPFHGYPQSMPLVLPPLGVVLLTQD